MNPTDASPDHSGSSEPVWLTTHSRPIFGPLPAAEQADVVIIGAGIAGLSTAYMLGRQGRSVVVLDDGPIAGGETERTTAHLSCALDDYYFEIEKVHGEGGSVVAANSHAAAIDEIERIVTAEQIECDFTRLDGFWFPHSNDASQLIEKEFEAAHRAGLRHVRIVARAPLPGLNTGRALCFPRQGQFNPLKYLSGLARAIGRDGGRIYSHTHVNEIVGGANAHVVTTDGKKVYGKAIVVATNTPVNDRVVIHTKQAAYRTYAIGASVPRGAVPVALYWDTDEPYHYVRLQAAADGGPEDILIVGGEDHKTGQANDQAERYAALEKWTRERFPIKDVRFRWSGQVMEPVDYMAFIGRNPMDHDNVFIATGDSGHGMTHGTIAGILLTDLILGRSNPWAELYSPSRVTAKAAPEFTRENANTAAQYADWITPADVSSEAEIAPDSGAILRTGLTKVAVYRDSEGRVTRCSAVCPHLGGIVRWNGAEKTWDCPAHGSRFERTGKVVNGPAITDLEPSEAPSASKS